MTTNIFTKLTNIISKFPVKYLNSLYEMVCSFLQDTYLRITPTVYTAIVAIL